MMNWPETVLMIALLALVLYFNEKSQDEAVQRHSDCILAAVDSNPTAQVRTAVLTCRAAYEKER